ncbi:MAG: ATP-binding protein [Fusobacterium sp.]|nr:ATP-binding protein [Fusobacterium sp.]
MRISSILNYSVNNKCAARPQANVPSLQYSYNLPCDTISFGQAKKISDAETREENSNKLIGFIKNKSFEDACNLIDRLDTDDWNPNCIIEDNTSKNCLLGLITDEFGNIGSEDKDWDNLISLADKVVSHPNFEIMNGASNQDMLIYSIDAYCPEVVFPLLNCPDCKNNIEHINLDMYAKFADEAGLAGVVDEIQKLKGSSSVYTIGGNCSSKNSSELKEALSSYEVPINENDPKSLDEVGGMFQVKKDVNEFILKPWNKDFRDKIIANKLNRPSGFLLSGPPGCGKTYIMKAIAAETGYKLYEINLANVGDSGAYKTQNELKTVFENLEKQYKLTGEPSILILDELDSIAMNRKNCQTDWKKDDINALLMVMNNSAQKGIIIVGATNNPDDLDPAVKRSGRLDKHIKLGLPTAGEAKDIVEKILQDRPIGSELLEHSDELAKKLKGLSPADMSSILHNACLNAIYEYKDAADMEDFDKMFNALKRDPNDKGRTVIKGFN